MAFQAIDFITSEPLRGYNDETDRIQRQNRQDLQYQKLLEQLEFERQKRPLELEAARTRNAQADANLFGTGLTNEVRQAGQAGALDAARIQNESNSALLQGGYGAELAKATQAQTALKTSNANTGINDNVSKEQLRALTDSANTARLELDQKRNEYLLADVGPERRARLAELRSAQEKFETIRQQQIAVRELIPAQTQAQGLALGAQMTRDGNTIALGSQQLATDRAQLLADATTAQNTILYSPEKYKLQLEKLRTQGASAEFTNQLLGQVDTITQAQQVLDNRSTFLAMAKRDGVDVNNKEALGTYYQTKVQQIRSATKSVAMRAAAASGSGRQIRLAAEDGSGNGDLIGGNLGAQQEVLPPHLRPDTPPAAAKEDEGGIFDSIKGFFSGGGKEVGGRGGETQRTTSRPVSAAGAGKPSKATSAAGKPGDGKNLSSIQKDEATLPVRNAIAQIDQQMAALQQSFGADQSDPVKYAQQMEAMQRQKKILEATFKQLDKNLGR